MEWRKEAVMTLMKWDPLFSELGFTKDRWTPAVDVFEDEHAITIKAELPGVEAKDVAVTLDNNVLTLKGERHFGEEVKKENYHRMERAYGTFTRSFALPEFVDDSTVKAEFKNGLLTLVLPKRAEAKVKNIEVRAA
jgi:HSP20 family protein